ncbi:hypothetical protein Ct9H90mP29_10210 [bacterium]|nr:MAG: hypothetical protein Ct9H90mP29_10210 [bacterium]
MSPYDFILTGLPMNQYQEKLLGSLQAYLSGGWPKKTYNAKSITGL